jgi:mono/diheme cytochrome c family protein
LPLSKSVGSAAPLARSIQPLPNQHGATIMTTTLRRHLLLAIAAALPALPAAADEAAIARGAYLVAVAGCALAGSEVGFEIPGLGTFYGPNLTPDRQTGLGAWTEAEIVAAFTTGVRPDGRILAPAMPWMGYANFTPEDAAAIAAFLKSVPPVSNEVPGPFGPEDTPTAFVMRVIPPGG